jgi:plastocyanin
MKLKSRTAIFPAILLLAALLLSACSKKENAPPSPGPATRETAPVTPIDLATAATIRGTVKYEGATPKAVKIDMSQDPACQGTITSETIVVDRGKLANVFVYVKDGLGNRSFSAPTTAATVDQRGCQYRPHVLGLMAGQPVEFKNDDPTTHNIHPMPKENREWNQAQQPQAPPIQKSFAHQEIMLPVQCNQHPWMKMYINVVNSPFFAVTDKDGNYEIKGLPPGDYTLAFVHEKLGEQDQKITLAPKDSKTVDAKFAQ